jgi:hypothetical protein
MNEGLSFAELKEAFNIFPSTLAARRKRFDESGQLTTRPIPESPPKINIDSLIKAAAKKPDAYVRELALSYGCSAAAVYKALKNTISLIKKVFAYREQSEAKREAYQARLRRVHVWKRVYVDESGIQQFDKTIAVW